MIMFSRGKIDLDEKQKLLEDSLKVSHNESEYHVLWLFSNNFFPIPSADSKTSLSENQSSRHLFAILGCRILHRIIRIMFVMC